MPRPLRPTNEGARQKQEDLEQRKERLRAEAAERQKAWDALSPSAQLKLLQTRPGESKKQRAKIEARVSKETAKPAPAPKAAPPAPLAPKEAAPAEESKAKGKKAKK